MHDKILKDYIVIHDNKGKLINKIQMDRIVVGLGFLNDQTLLIVLSKGVYLTCNPFTGHTKFMTITPEAEFEKDPIAAVKIFGNNFVYMTKSYNFYLIENVRAQVKSKIFTPSEQYRVNETASSFSVLPGRSKEEPIKIFIPAVVGLIKATQHPLSQQKEQMFQNFTKPIILTSVSPNGKNLAVLTQNAELVRHFVDFLKKFQKN